MRRSEEILAKESSALVNRYRVADDLEIGILGGLCEREMYSVVHPADGTYRIPNTDKMWLAFTRERVLEISRDCEINVLVLNHANRIWNQAFVSSCKEAHYMEHSAESSRRVGAPAEAENIDAVARIVIPHQELKSVGNVIRDAIAEGEADQLRPPLPNMDQRATCAHRAHTGMIIRDLTGVTDEGLIELDDIGVLRAELVPRSITADNNLLGHGTLPEIQFCVRYVTRFGNAKGQKFSTSGSLR